VIVITVISTTMFMVLSSWLCHCEGSPGLFDKCSTSTGQPPIFGQSQSAWISDPPKLAAAVLHVLVLRVDWWCVLVPQVPWCCWMSWTMRRRGAMSWRCVPATLSVDLSLTPSCTSTSRYGRHSLASQIQLLCHYSSADWFNHLILASAQD